jgi:protein SCO1
MRFCLLFVLLAAPAFAAPDVGGIAFEPHPGATVPRDAAFADEAGRRVRLGDVLGDHAAVLALGYYHCPNLCGTVRADLFAALAATGLQPGVDYRAVLLSIDPAETPAQAAVAKSGDMARAAVPGAEAGWRFLTGPSAAVAESVGYRARWDTRLQQFLHPAGIVVLTPAGAVSSYLLGVGYDAATLRHAIRQAQTAQVAAPPSPILLLCFHYDAGTGRYTLAIERVLQGAAVLAVASIAGLLTLLHRRHA